MNKQLELYAREALKETLPLCTEAQQLLFKRMYSHKDLQKDINDVVDNIPVEKLSIAMSQVDRTLLKNNGRR